MKKLDLNQLAKRIVDEATCDTPPFKPPSRPNSWAALFFSGGAVDYAMLVKIYGEESQGQKRYSPAQFVNAEKRRITGSPDMKEVSTSYVERQNLTMRMGMRRFTRLTNGFSKKIENLEHAVALHFMHYNFCRIHKTLKTTPALEAGITDKLWSLENIAALLD